MQLHFLAGQRILGYIWPKRTKCPECSSTHWVSAGYVQRGSLQYRRCLSYDCGHVYKIAATHAHIDRGGEQSEVVALS